MMKIAGFVGLFVLIAASQGCDADSIVKPDFRTAVATDSTLYHAVSNGSYFHFQITTTVRNPLLHTLYLGRCFPSSDTPIYYTRLDNSSEGGSAYSPAWGCVGHDQQFVLHPGESRSFSFDLGGPNAFKDGRYFGVLTGTTRIVIEACTQVGDCDEAKREWLQSNAFQVDTVGGIPLSRM